ncbi:MAG TPA: DNA topoisomerase, partial [Baekduia sp.]|nr:DNA topoisomerase [Baekduia sp.]
FDNTSVETTVGEHVFRTRGKILVVPGWRGVWGELADDQKDDEDEGKDQNLPRLEEGESSAVREVEVLAKETKPPGRYSDASLLGAMEGAGKLVDDEAMREAMSESGIGTPATRAAIIERLIDVGYVERDARALVPTEKGMNVIRLLGDHPLTSPSLTGDWEKRLSEIEEGKVERKKFMADIAKFAGETIGELDVKLKDVKIPRANLGPCPICGRDIIENRKGFSCWGREDPGCGFVIWKAKAGKTLTAAIARELIKAGHTEKQVTGFKSRQGRNFRARLALVQNEEGRMRVEFNEPWAQEGYKAPEVDDAELAVASPATAELPATGDSAA